MKHSTFPAQGTSLDELLFWWPSITRRATEEWAKGFCQSVLKQSKRRNWKPSDKQLHIMRQLHREMFSGTNDDMQVVE